MSPGADSGTVAALMAVSVASNVVVPILSEDSDSSPSSLSTTIPAQRVAGVATPVTTASLIAAEVPDAYRNKSCDYLEVAVVFAHERLDGRKEANDIEGQQVAQARIAARSQALSEKNCPPSTWVGGRIGISHDNIDPRYVATYKIPAEGAMVLFVSPKSTAEKAGIKVGDVIIAVNDKPILDAIDLRTVLGHAPIGSVQRLKIRRDTTFLVVNTEMAGPATPLPTPAASVKATPQVEQSATSIGAMYCTAGISTQHTYGATVSPVKLIEGAAKDMRPSLTDYIAKVKKKQPGVWGEFKLNPVICAPGRTVCMGEAKGPTGKIQNAFSFCHATQAKADAELQQMRQGDPKAVVVEWP